MNGPTDAIQDDLVPGSEQLDAAHAGNDRQVKINPKYPQAIGIESIRELVAAFGNFKLCLWHPISHFGLGPTSRLTKAKMPKRRYMSLILSSQET